MRCRGYPAILVAAVAALSACNGAPTTDEPVGQTASAIIAGTEDVGDDAVGGLVGGGGEAYCSGTLVAPRAVLTAAHCLAGHTPRGVRFKNATIAVTSAKQHPAFDLLSLVHDVAIVTLEVDAPATPVPTAVSPGVGDRVRVAGWGVTSSTEAAADGPTDAERRSGFERVVQVSNDDFRGNPDPSSPCSGDSGGPVFDEHNAVVGVISSGDSHCSAYALAARVDTHAEFISDAISPAKTSSGCAVGARISSHSDASLSFVACAVVAMAFRVVRRKSERYRSK